MIYHEQMDTRAVTERTVIFFTSSFLNSFIGCRSFKIYTSKVTNLNRKEFQIVNFKYKIDLKRKRQRHTLVLEFVQ